MLRKLLPVLLALPFAACVDLNQSRPYSCRADASVAQLESSPDCAEGQICGFEGYCRSKDAPGPFRCDRATGFGCGSNYFCAVDGVCRDVDAGGAFSCERFAADASVPPKIPTFADGGPNDCGNSGWRCGATGTCQQIGVAGEYTCAQDSDCEARGRCGGAGVCVNPELDRLLPRDAGVLSVTVLSPRAVLPSSEAFALSSAPPYPFPFVQVNGGSVGAILPDLSTVTLGDAGVGAVSAGATGTVAYVGTGNELLSLPLNGSPATSFPELAGAQLRTSSFQALAFNDAGNFWLPAQNVGPGPIDIPDGGVLEDVAFVPGFAGKETSCVLAMHSRGLAVGGTDSKAFSFINVDLGLCTGACGPLAPSLRGSDFRLATTDQALTITALKSGDVKLPNPLVTLFSADWSGGGIIDVGGSGCGPVLGLKFSNCVVPCDAAHLVDVRPVANLAGVAHAVCREEQSGRPVLTVYSLTSAGGAACDTKAEFFEASLFNANPRVTSRPDAVTAVGPLGQLWSVSQWDQPQVLTLDHTATGSVSFSDGGTFFFADPVIAYPAPMGMLTAPPTSVLFEKPVAEVGNAPSWYVGESRRFIEGPRDVRGTIKLSAADFQPPVRAERLQRSDGRVVVVASVRDTLLAAEVPSDGGFFEALPRLVPQARVDILALSVTGNVPDGGYLAGYLLTTGGVFQLDAEAINRWHTTELTLPDTDPLALWTDGLRGRVGMPNGVIYSLPSRVQIAPELPEPVVAFGTLCDEPFALTSGGVYRLGYGENQGIWTPVPEALAPLRARLPPQFDLTQELGEGQLLQVNGNLVIVTRSGAAVQLSPSTPCAK